MLNYIVKIVLPLWITATMTLSVQAAVPAEQAQRLGKDLTPLGAERFGNTAGSIPAWRGGLTAEPEGVSFDPASGRHLPNPYANEKPLYTISAQNIDQYADKVTPGQKALLAKYPETYKMHVYPTHRSAAAPQWVYDNTAKNALHATLTADGEGLTGAYGGIPFPLPQKGAEAIFNHLARWKGGDSVEVYTDMVVHADGSRTDCGGGKYTWDWPYYNKGGSVETWNGLLGSFLIEYQTPSARKGEIILTQDPLDYTKKKRAVWQYRPGQRRIRRVPSMAYDTPSQTLAGMITIDDVFMYTGAIDAYNWVLKGKKEIILPYHNYGLVSAELEKALTPGHINPEFVRWELHRVWVVEAQLKQGERHIYARRVMHLDEDTWANVMEDKYNSRGELWRTAVGYSVMDWTVPVLFSTTRAYYDLQRRDYGVSGVRNGMHSKRTFTKVDPAILTPQHVRKLGKH
jgi:hypothetical protein